MTRQNAAETILQDAIAAQRRGDLMAARAGYAQLAEQGTDAVPMRLLALLLSDQGDTEGAIAWARRAVARDPTAAHNAAALARVLLAAGLPSEAEQACRQALTLDATLPAAHGLLAPIGHALLRRGQTLFAKRLWIEAADAFVAAMRVLPVSAAMLHDLGVAWHESGRLEQAERAYRDSLALDATRAETWHNLASLRQARRDMADAMACYARAYALRADFFPRIAQELAAGNPGRVWLDTGDLRRALTRLSAVEREP